MNYHRINRRKEQRAALQNTRYRCFHREILSDFCCLLLFRARLYPLFRDPMDYHLPGSSVACPWNFPSKNTGVGCHFLLQGIFPTQGSNQVSCIASGFFTAELPGESCNETSRANELCSAVSEGIKRRKASNFSYRASIAVVPNKYSPKNTVSHPHV